MRGERSAWAWGLLWACATTAVAQDEPPPLAPPSESPPVAPRPASPLRPVFRPTGPALPRLEPVAPELQPPPLTAPTEMGLVEPDARPLFGVEPPARPGSRPLVLESTPLDRLDPLQGPKPRSVPSPIEPTPAPRRFRLFGRFQPRPSPRPAAPLPRDDALTVEPASDPAADAALKRRIEAQVRSAVGGRLRSLEVRVVDRTVQIRARADRFWQRRGVRRAIEALPALSGYNTVVEVED